MRNALIKLETADPANDFRRLERAFFEREAVELSRALLGTIMIRRFNGISRRARIVEVEAYLGPHDLASHSSKGRTKRTEVMFGPPGKAYVYFVYGMHWMFNVVCGTEGQAQAVLVRSGQPLDDWDVILTGPARFARGFEIARAENGLDLSGEDIVFYADPTYRTKIAKSKRIGVDYAGNWKHRLLRFIDARSPVASKLRF